MKSILTTCLTYCLFFALLSCNTEEGFQGTYTCQDCLYTQLDFKSDGTVEIQAGEINAKGDFSIEDKKLTISTETTDYVFMIKDANTLEGVEDVEGVYKKSM